MEMEELTEQKDLVGGQYRHRLHRATRNKIWLIPTPYCLNGTDLSWEEFWDNMHLRYGLMPHYIPVTCNKCGKKFLIKHSL